MRHSHDGWIALRILWPTMFVLRQPIHDFLNLPLPVRDETQPHAEEGAVDE